MNIILCGLKSCGKTTIGKRLALALGWDFTDTDAWIEEAYKQKKGGNFSCRQIAVREGEPYFRALERELIARPIKLTATIIAVGGGIFADPENKKNLKRLGRILYLKADPRTLWNRIKQTGIPSYVDPHDPENSFYAIAEKRIPVFEQAADIILDTEGLNEDDIVDIVLNKEPLHGKQQLRQNF